MDAKREARKQRAELHRQTQERRRRQRVMRTRLLIALGTAAVLAIGVMVARRDKPSGGRVWSAAHGHWHER
jgi:hypothetical protein